MSTTRTHRERHASPDMEDLGWSAPDLRRMTPKAGSKEGAITQDDLDFIHDARSLLKRRRGGLRSWSPWLLIFTIVALTWWAAQAEIDEVTRGQGKVVPSRAVQIIQSLEGGILEELYVIEGQTVEPGQNLVRIRDVIFASSYQENLARRDVLEARLIRLKAETEMDQALEFPPAVRPELVTVEGQLFAKRRADMLATQGALESRLTLMRQEESLLQTGATSRAVSPIELLRVQKEVAAIVGELKTLQSTFERQAMEQLDKDRAEFEGLVQAIKRDKDRLDRTVIKSEVRGVVNKIHINSVGRVVGSGADIMSIVPTDDTLLLEANIKPADIAFIRPGEAARVRFTAYDFATYGGLDGTVERIGADTVTDDPQRPGRPAQVGSQGSPQGSSFYTITVRTNKNSLGKAMDGRDLVIMPGMVAEVDILTGKKTVLSYLLKPIYQARERALRER